MKTFNYDIDDCFNAACNSLGREMGISSKPNSHLRSDKKFFVKKKKKISLYEKVEFAILLIFAKLFI
ncbi:MULTISPECIES: hypothetical protein [Chryseobacterium]|uniref:Uncharacterized protein n=1 Tax=Chryseobacterium salivictor TaxID=2547600 RepID=A0A4P6ZCR9_9FLAO|nr:MULTISPECIES: hypothetical protein [Chryseobacterium]MDQ0476929.1 hypothetical protein [Chryseobacterium sp. MDT2-18]QBO57293.1 hypothetical protein NBC122_00444 [Chryseobacterium salivictor]